MKKKQILFLSVLALVLSLFSFQKSANEATQRELAKRLKKHREMKIRRCNQMAMEEVNIIVDSMLLERAQILKTAPIPKPPIPPKPTAPDVKHPDEGAAIKPIFDN